MIDYEIQQNFIKDIEWISKTKDMVIEIEERKARFAAEKAIRQAQIQKMKEERKKRDEEYKAREEIRRKEREAKQAEWEAAQFQKLEVHPYVNEIDQCEHLIYFCAKNRVNTKETTEQTTESTPVEATPEDQ